MEVPRKSLACMALILSLVTGCEGDSCAPVSGSGGEGDGGTDAGPDAAQVTPPVPYPLKVFTRAPPAVDCGPGCRVLLGPVGHADGVSFSYSMDQVADTSFEELMVRRPGENEVLVVTQSSAQSYLEGDLLGYTFVDDFPRLDMVVLDTKTHQAKTYFHTDRGDLYQSRGNVLTDKYFFWAHGGSTTRANLTTGELTDFGGALDCDRGCFGAGSIYCGLGTVYRFDPETLFGTPVDDGGAAQMDPTCSPDRKRMAWVDFRDPPGQVSSYLGAHIGGEIYVHEFDTGATTRLTFDSPDNPITKSTAAIGTDVAAWMEPCAACEKNFDGFTEWNASPKAIVRLDLTTMKRCRYERERTGGYFAVNGHHLYTYWNDLVHEYLIDIDMDDPAVPWVCD